MILIMLFFTLTAFKVYADNNDSAEYMAEMNVFMMQYDESDISQNLPNGLGKTIESHNILTTETENMNSEPESFKQHLKLQGKTKNKNIYSETMLAYPDDPRAEPGTRPLIEPGEMIDNRQGVNLTVIASIILLVVLIGLSIIVKNKKTNVVAGTQGTNPTKSGESAKTFYQQGQSQCRQCEAIMPIEQQFCTVCGTPALREGVYTQENGKAKHCTTCGFVLQAETNFCTNCGEKI